MVKNLIPDYETGLVLSGGGVRGFAHVGALKALNEHGIFPNIISGTSTGALVGALYADGYTPDEIMHLFFEKKLFKYLELVVPKKGLLKMTGLARIFSHNLRAKTFEDLKIPLIACSTDFTNGLGVYFKSGELYKSILASATVPILFPPIVINDVAYVDGGIFDNFPVKPIFRECKNIIGINVNPSGVQNDFSSLMNIAERSFQLSMEAGMFAKRSNCQLFLEPPELKKYRLLDFSKSNEIFHIGYKYTKLHLEQNPEILNTLMN
jgi:NTE family protein